MPHSNNCLRGSQLSWMLLRIHGLQQELIYSEDSSVDNECTGDSGCHAIEEDSAPFFSPAHFCAIYPACIDTLLPEHSPQIVHSQAWKGDATLRICKCWFKQICWCKIPRVFVLPDASSMSVEPECQSAEKDCCNNSQRA